jgi:hypothetical protein
VTHGVEGERYCGEREPSEETAVAEVVAGVQQKLRWCCGAAPLDVGAGDDDLRWMRGRVCEGCRTLRRGSPRSRGQAGGSASPWAAI